MRDRIPEATVARLPVYLRCLVDMSERGTHRVSSDQLAEAAGVNSAKVRKDLSYLGSYGTRGVGYDVEYLIYQVRREPSKPVAGESINISVVAWHARPLVTAILEYEVGGRRKRLPMKKAPARSEGPRGRTSFTSTIPPQSAQPRAPMERIRKGREVLNAKAAGK